MAATPPPGTPPGVSPVTVNVIVDPNAAVHGELPAAGNQPPHSVVLLPPQPHLLPGQDTRLQGSKKWDTCKNVAFWGGIALAVSSLVVGIIGLLVYVGILQISLTNVGTMSQALGLYTMLGGLGLTFITALLLSVSRWLSASHEATTSSRTKGLCCTDRAGTRSLLPPGAPPVKQPGQPATA